MIDSNYFLNNVYEYIVKRRAQVDPDSLYRRLRERKRPSIKKFYTRGILILALDHTARMNISVGNNKYALINRRDLLLRITKLLLTNLIDGILVIPDILDELLIIDELIEEKTGSSIFDDLILMGSVNRGGLSGSVFELDDRVTAYTPKDIIKLGLDAAKFLLRIDLSNPDTVKTLDYAQSIARECDEYGLPLFIEVFPVIRDEDGEYKMVKNPYDLAAAVGVASALGFSSLRKFLKLPYTDEFHIVTQSTTLPIYILGGGSGSAKALCNEIKLAFNSGPNVIGAVIGRNILYPSDMSPEDAVRCIKNTMTNA